HHCFGFSSLLDYNGSGLFDANTAAKVNTIANFYATTPSLPFFVDKRRQEYHFVAKDCLLHHRLDDKELLLWSARDAISCLPLGTNSDSKNHCYTDDNGVDCGPFRSCSPRNASQLFVFDDIYAKPILELKANDLHQIQTISRNKITFFNVNRGSSDDESDLSLDVFQALSVNSVATNEESMFECCDRNDIIDNELVISYTTDDVIHLYDLETSEKITAFDLKAFDKTLSAKTQIGVEWSPCDPNIFLYGQNNQIVGCDTRADGSCIKIIDTKHNDNQYKWEMFYKFLPSKLNPYQLFVATDYHLFITDCRYPQMNLIQLRHMLPKIVIQNLKSLVVDGEDAKSEIVVTSDIRHNCLMSFKSVAELTALSSLHLPLHTSTPHDKMFECCDRNDIIDNELVISYTTDDVIHLYDLETSEKITAFDLKLFDKTLSAKTQIGVEWSPCDPNIFLYGQNNQIVGCDTRADGSCIKIIDTKHNDNQYKWEMFYKFLPSKLNPYQLFVATDYHLFITDCRYPQMNLIQLRHMLPKIVIQNLKSLVVDNEARIQLLDSGDKSGFSLALLTQMGDIFMQDFYWDCFDDTNGKLNDGKPRDRTCASGVGSNELTLSKESEEYMQTIREFIYNLQFNKAFDSEEHNQCLVCFDKRVCKIQGNECQCRGLIPIATEDESMSEEVIPKEVYIDTNDEEGMAEWRPRCDPCGIVCIVSIYLIIIYTDYAFINWIVLPLNCNLATLGLSISVFQLILILLVWSHLKAAVSDPGVVPHPTHGLDISAKQLLNKKDDNEDHNWSTPASPSLPHMSAMCPQNGPPLPLHRHNKQTEQQRLNQ
ncbi:unnamed protein product, partial [Medioppia subpectinata]